MVADKPCDVSIHNEPGKDLCSILSSHIEADISMQTRLSFESGFGLHAVHRLDKQTSGVVLLACRQDIFRYYAAQFQGRTVRKRYVALLHGRLSPSLGAGGRHLWNWPLTRSAGGRASPAGKGKRLACQTRVRVLRLSPHYTLAECEPLTGRKHQIRRHAKLAGHPVVGDRRYGTRRSLQYLKDRCRFTRLGLHAMAITVRTPGKSEPQTIRSPEIPPEMQRLLDEDRTA